MRRYVFFVLAALIGLTLYSCSKTQTGSTTQSRGATPNILVIYFDNLGYGDVSAYGQTTLQTPNIDNLAAGGVRFTNGYATSATCTPTTAC